MIFWDGIELFGIGYYLLRLFKLFWIFWDHLGYFRSSRVVLGFFEIAQDRLGIFFLGGGFV